MFRQEITEGVVEEPPEEKKLFEAIKGDVISEAITDIINEHGEDYPIIRITANKYLVGRDIC